MYLVILLLPFLGAFVSGFFGRSLGVKGAKLFTCIIMLLEVFLVIYLYIFMLLYDCTISIVLFNWFDLDEVYVNWGFMFDSLSLSMLIPITIVSMLVHLYSVGYMNMDFHQQRFFSYLSLFTFFMIVLITGDNLLVMFVGWEGVGICSYLLINFWFTRIQANKAAMSAIMVNRVGDMFLTLGMFIIVYFIGSLDYGIIFSSFYEVNDDLVFFIGILFLLGAMAKSAQIGLHQWLPLAMEAPTPVSALLHAATMITAGVYLFIRLSPIVEYSSLLLLLILFIGGITSLLASLIGLFQNDIKKVIAYSTCSQLGMMFVAIGLSQYSLALYHLFNHAFFKALLFLGAGSVIHGMLDDQDMRKYGGLGRYLGFTRNMFIIGSVALMALPYTSGYFSKDFIIESLYGICSYEGRFLFIVVLFGSFITSMYSVKILYKTFYGNRVSFNNNLIYRYVHEPVLSMGIPLILLGIFSIISGIVFRDLFIGLGSDCFDRSIFVLFDHYKESDIEFIMYIEGVVKLLPMLIFFVSLIYYLRLLRKECIVTNFFLLLELNFILVKKFFINLFNNKFYYEYFVNKYVLISYMNFSYYLYKYVDQGFLDKSLIGVLLNNIYNIGSLSSSDKYNLNVYILYMFFGVLFICLFFSYNIIILYYGFFYFLVIFVLFNINTDL